MKYTIYILSVFCSQFIFAQNADSTLQQLVRHDTIHKTPTPEYTKIVWSFDEAIRQEDSLLLVLDQIEISSLNSTKATLAFFKTISDLTSIIEKTKIGSANDFGFGSTKHDSVLEVSEKIDQYLFDKMREYLSLYPYPKRGGKSEHFLPSSVIMKVFDQADETPENIDLKKFYFPIFYQAYKEKDIYSGDFWTLLYHMYNHINDTTYVNFEDSEEEQIEEMINLLDLDRK